METKVKELRPDECNTRIADIVEKDGKRLMKVKCRRCSKRADSDVYHYVDATMCLVVAQ